MTNQLPLVTIGIAAYNGDKYISKAIESVLHQNYSNFKLIISDDCSNDNTQKICCNYAEKDRRIEYIRQSTNLGSISNYYFLYMNAKIHSKYFKFLDQDDWLIGDSFLNTLITSLENGYDFALSNVTIRHTEEHGFHDKRNTNSIFEKCHSNYDYSKAVIDQASMGYYSVFNVESIGKYLEKYFYIKHREDNVVHFLEGALCLEIASELKAKYISTESFIYQLHGENLSRTTKVAYFIKDYRLYLRYCIGYIIFESDFNRLQKIYLSFLITKKIKYLVLRLYGSFFKSKFKNMLN